MELSVLTLTSYGEEEGETYRVTPSPSSIFLVCADERLVKRQGMNLYMVQVKFLDEGGAEFYLTREDLEKLEQAVGVYDPGTEI